MPTRGALSAQECSLSRLEKLCWVAQVDLPELARGVQREQLTRDQEQELVNDTRLLIVAVCAMGNVRMDDIVRVYDIAEAQCIRLRARLDKIGLPPLTPNNGYRR